jgi:hypothetical protein
MIEAWNYAWVVDEEEFFYVWQQRGQWMEGVREWVRHGKKCHVFLKLYEDMHIHPQMVITLTFS